MVMSRLEVFTDRFFFGLARMFLLYFMNSVGNEEEWNWGKFECQTSRIDGEMQKETYTSTLSTLTPHGSVASSRVDCIIVTIDSRSDRMSPRFFVPSTFLKSEKRLAMKYQGFQLLTMIFDKIISQHVSILLSHLNTYTIYMEFVPLFLIISLWTNSIIKTKKSLKICRVSYCS